MTNPTLVRWHVGRVIGRRYEADSAVRLELDVPTWPGNDAGSHLDLRLTAPDGYQASRSYSLASSGESTRVVLVVHEVPDGEVSPFLVHQLAEGDEVEIQGPLGRYFIWNPADPDRSPVQLIAGGSGVVPLFSMASAREGVEESADFRLLYSVRTPRDVLFADELGALSRTTVDIVHTRESPPRSVRPPGRLTRDGVAAVSFSASASPRTYICGPTAFVETIVEWLLELGHDPARIRTERFGGSN
ncbi:FAD-binding oxidoreductase [Rhodococcus qingshengii]|jgi:ferredoxin-NADP reductase|uniref:FAD-binding oxidoreductase n=2 Tax=Actinomycetota TaxID=201174 RepID=UPI0001A219E2|nr:FAD-binding oxidoreductase [Rhodococcus qingshengii]EEN86492.1 oxidoreductase, FAD-binding protein [Rhodococcus erythropolis SK121]MDN5544287.1 FAD-binding oxidoreductase [Rhodococcus sp. (in: high G+C Gram-positive bacteria)]